MMFQVGDDGVVSSANEEDLIYIDKNELDQFIESYHKLEKENEQLKKSVKRQQSSNSECAKLIEEQQKEIEALKQVLADNIMQRYEIKEAWKERFGDTDDEKNKINF